MPDGDLQLYPLWPALRSDMLLAVIYPEAPLPHYISVGQLSSFIAGGGISLPLAIAQGGTSATDPAGARSNLGAAALDSPALTGTPTAPTQLPGDDSTRLATTAFVVTAAGAPSWDNITNKPPTFPPTLPIAEADVTNLIADLAAKAPLASPVFTGTPTAPTASAADNSTRIATTAFVKAAIAGGASLTISDTPPPVTAGALWWDSAGGQLFVGYDDGSSTQWVIAVNQPGAAGATVTAGSGLTLAGTVMSLTTPALPLTGGAINGGLTINSPGGAAIQVTVPAGVLAQTIMTVTGGRTWVTYVSYSDGTYAIYDGTAAAARLTIDAAGACFNTSGSWSAISARELKEQVEPYTTGLEAVLELEPVTFRYSAGTPFARPDEPSDPIVGLIADQVEPHIPEMCGTTTITIRDEPREVQTLSPGDLVYVLINSIKELNEKIERLEQRS